MIFEISRHIASQNPATIRQTTLEEPLISLKPSTPPITVSTRSINEYTKFLRGETRWAQVSNLFSKPLKKLRLAEVSMELPALMREAEQQSWTYHEFLNHLLNFELTKREEKNKVKRLKWAKFPYHKTLEAYELSEQTSLTER